MSKIEVDEELAKQYSRVKGVSLEDAYKTLEANFVKELVDVDLRQQYHVLMNSFRKMQPQLQGLVLRETDINQTINSLKSEIKSSRHMLLDLQEMLKQKDEDMLILKSTALTLDRKIEDLLLEMDKLRDIKKPEKSWYQKLLERFF